SEDRLHQHPVELVDFTSFDRYDLLLRKADLPKVFSRWRPAEHAHARTLSDVRRVGNVIEVSMPDEDRSRPFDVPPREAERSEVLHAGATIVERVKQHHLIAVHELMRRRTQ